MTTSETRLLLAGALLAALLGAGCATATIEDAVPREALESTEPAVELAETETADGPENTGEYPNLNEVQRGAAAQMTPEERSAHLAALAAARKGQSASAGGRVQAASEAELKRIAREHDDEVLKEIESGTTEEDEDEE